MNLLKIRNSILFAFILFVLFSCMNNKRYFNNTYNSEFKGVRSDIHRDINNHNSIVLYLKIENNELSNIVAD
jgi:hypothetical protein